jgi:hypothetical protein
MLGKSLFQRLKNALLIVFSICFSVTVKQNGDHPLRYHVYNLCFANFLLGRHPHGPGEFLFGPFEGSTNYSTMFPIDYSALNTPPETMEPYSPNKQSNRRSVVVWCQNDNIQTVTWSMVSYVLRPKLNQYIHSSGHFSVFASSFVYPYEVLWLHYSNYQLRTSEL